MPPFRLRRTPALLIGFAVAALLAGRAAAQSDDPIAALLDAPAVSPESQQAPAADPPAVPVQAAPPQAAPAPAVPAPSPIAAPPQGAPVPPAEYARPPQGYVSPADAAVAPPEPSASQAAAPVASPPAENARPPEYARPPQGYVSPTQAAPPPVQYARPSQPADEEESEEDYDRAAGGPAVPPAPAPVTAPSYARPAPAMPFARQPSQYRARGPAPVHVDETGRSPEAPPSGREIDYEQRLRASFAAAQGMQGPLDGSWTLSADPGGDIYSLELVDRGDRPLEGAWRDLRRAGAVSGSGFLEDAQRYGAQLTFRFRPQGAQPVVATLSPRADGRWSGELVEGRERRAVSLRRN